MNTGTACAYADAVHLLWILGADVGILGWSGSHCTPHAIRIGQLCGATSCLCLASMRWWLDGLLIAFGWACTPLLGSKGMEANLHRCGFTSTHWIGNLSFALVDPSTYGLTGGGR